MLASDTPDHVAIPPIDPWALLACPLIFCLIGWEKVLEVLSLGDGKIYRKNPSVGIRCGAGAFAQKLCLPAMFTFTDPIGLIEYIRVCTQAQVRHYAKTMRLIARERTKLRQLFDIVALFDVAGSTATLWRIDADSLYYPEFQAKSSE